MCTTKKHITIGVGVGAAIGATIAFLALHEPTKNKIIKHAKRVHKEALKVIKEQAKKIETN